MAREHKHTPGEWYRNGAFVRTQGYEWIAECAFAKDGTGLHSFPRALEASDNARRIVQCVNACAGMPDPVAEVAGLKRERDMLLDACGALFESTGKTLRGIWADRINEEAALDAAGE